MFFTYHFILIGDEIIYEKSLCIVLCLLGISGRMWATDSKEKAIPLSEEEISKANEAFVSVIEVTEGNRTILRASEISCFFTSYYSEPSEINLQEFLRYCPFGTTLEDDDAEEFQALIAALPPENVPDKECVFPSEFGVPIHRIYKEDVSSLLTEYANITVDDLSNTDGTIYLEEYEAFYTFTSDFGPGSFTCVGGERLGNTISLWAGTNDGERTTLTLHEIDGNYVIASFQKMKAEE